MNAFACFHNDVESQFNRNAPESQYDDYVAIYEATGARYETRETETGTAIYNHDLDITTHFDAAGNVTITL